jgi:Cyclic nucleotide-binding domain/Major Facilitator Superfamily
VTPGGSARTLGTVFRNRSLRRALIGYFSFNSAEWGTWVAVLVFAHRVGGTAAAGIVSVVMLVPATLVAPFGSVLGDRMARERALALGYFAQAGGVSLVALTVWLDMPTALIYGCAAIAASSQTLTRPVHNALLPALAETPGELTAANSASSTVEGLATFAGPLITSAILGVADAAAVFAFFALAQLASGVLLLTVRGHESIGTAEADVDAVVGGALSGFRELLRDRAAGVLLLVVGAQFVVVGLLDVLAVVLGVDVLGLGESGPGFIASAAGVGTLVGGACTVILIGRRRLSAAFIAGAVVVGLPLIAVAGVGGALAAVALVAVSGAGKSFVDVAGRTLLQRSVRDDVLARVFGVQEAVAMGALLIGSAAAPVLVGLFGARGAFVAAGAFLPVLALFAWRPIGGLDRRAAPPDPERIAVLRGLPLFQPVAQPALEQVASRLIPLTVGAGETVIREGEPGDRFYVLVEGEVAVSATGRRIATLGPGDYFGEIALLRDVPRTATVSAISASRLFALERDDFLAAVGGSRSGAQAADREVRRRLATLDDLD